MQGLVPVVLGSWVALTLALFARYRGRDAALASMIAGWALLPTATFPATVFRAPVGSGGSLHALAVPTTLVVNKATAIGLGCLAGMLLFDWPLVRRLRPGRVDLPIAVWCLVPVASALANGLSPGEGLAASRYLALAWGVPYLVGRVYLSGDESLRRFGLGFVLAGLLYAPICLTELAVGPFVYTSVYGPHPYQLAGAARSFGYRPLGFLEQGNQLGLWAAVTAVAAAWLESSGRLRSVAGLPGKFAAFGLVGLCALDQSHGAIVLTALAILAIAALRLGPTPGIPFRHAAAGLLAVAVLAATAGLALGGGVAGLRGRLKEVAVATGKGSFTWRLARYEDHLARVAERPLLGWSRADWSSAPDHTFVDPVALGLWLHALGMFGVVGLLASTAVFVCPVVEVVRVIPVRAWLNPACGPVSLAAVLLLVGLGDSLLNSTVLLPLIAGAGGLNSWSGRRVREV